MPNQPEKKSSGTEQPKAIDAVRHVGPTLESEEEQPYVPARDEEVSREEIAKDSDLHVHKVETHGRETRIVEEGKPGTEAEPLHTRLAGDTSSDPHTDTGPETPRPVVNERPKNAA